MIFSSYYYTPLRPQSPWKIQPYVLIGFLTISMTLSFLAGRAFPPMAIQTTSYNTIPLKQTPVTFTYNRTFSSPPSNITNRAWKELFPPQGTYFTHPPLVAQRSTLAVYHQLHCLDGIRRNFYRLYATVHDDARGVLGVDGKEVEMMEGKAMAHVRHCIDLLRQSLMCLADTTVEVKDDVRGGVRGFEVEHRCSDWGELGDLVGKWQQ